MLTYLEKLETKFFNYNEEKLNAKKALAQNIEFENLDIKHDLERLAYYKMLSESYRGLRRSLDELSEDQHGEFFRKKVDELIYILLNHPNTSLNSGSDRTKEEGEIKGFQSFVQEIKEMYDFYFVENIT